MRGAFVIARNSAFSYKGKAIDVRQVGRELNVRYVLEGSVQRSGKRLRVNVQLIDAETGNHLWAERFDKPVADLFDMQDEIVSRLANTLNSQLIAVEARRAERSPHPDATDLCFQGAAWVNRGRTPENLAQARGFFERALGLEPENVEALVGTALVNFAIGAGFITDDQAEHLTAAEAAVTKALSLAPNHPLAHFVLGLVQTFTNRAALGIAECERALALDRNLARAHANIGTAKFFLGQGAETEAHTEQALRLSSRDTCVYIWTMYVGLAKFSHGADAEAIVWLRRSLEANRNFPIRHFYLAAVLAHAGELDEARATAQAGLARVSVSAATALTTQATIPCISRFASASVRACEWPGYPRANVGSGSLASFLAPTPDVCSSPDSGGIDVCQPLLGASVDMAPAQKRDAYP
jgi:Tfp pilus assembly protein PilF